MFSTALVYKSRKSVHVHPISIDVRVYQYMYMYIVLNTCLIPSSHTEAQEDPEKYRFQVELEFVQCLANPHYLNCKSAHPRGFFPVRNVHKCTTDVPEFSFASLCSGHHPLPCTTMHTCTIDDIYTCAFPYSVRGPTQCDIVYKFIFTFLHVYSRVLGLLL